MQQAAIILWPWTMNWKPVLPPHTFQIDNITESLLCFQSCGFGCTCQSHLCCWTSNAYLMCKLGVYINTVTRNQSSKYKYTLHHTSSFSFFFFFFFLFWTASKIFCDSRLPIPSDSLIDLPLQESFQWKTHWSLASSCAANYWGDCVTVRPLSDAGLCRGVMGCASWKAVWHNLV